MDSVHSNQSNCMCCNKVGRPSCTKLHTFTAVNNPIYRFRRLGTLENTLKWPLESPKCLKQRKQPRMTPTKSMVHKMVTPIPLL